ncbi:MAG: hypothetical protein H6Q71_932 [Firmicutes bacterium]|nr:hypothetical protein [Bacillota bacterium]
MIKEENIIKKIVVAMLMGLFIFGGAVNSNICNAYNEYDIIQWNYQRERIQVDVANTIGVSKDVVAYFMEEGYAPRDIVMAGLLVGKNSSINGRISNINEILSKKTSSNSWRDVAITMGVDQEAFNQYVEKAKKII